MLPHACQITPHYVYLHLCYVSFPSVVNVVASVIRSRQITSDHAGPPTSNVFQLCVSPVCVTLDQIILHPCKRLRWHHRHLAAPAAEQLVYSNRTGYTCGSIVCSHTVRCLMVMNKQHNFDAVPAPCTAMHSHAHRLPFSTASATEHTHGVRMHVGHCRAMNL